MPESDGPAQNARQACLLWNRKKMAQLPRVTATAPQAVSTAQPRIIATGRVASVATPTVEEPGFSTAAQLDTAPFAFYNTTPEPANDDKRQQGHKRQHFGLLNTQSESFAAILQSGLENTELDRYGNPVSKVTAGALSKAIKTYEFNHRVISGTDAVRGTEISLTL